MKLKDGMVVTCDEKCHDGTTVAVMEVFDDDGVLSLRCKTCGDVYSVTEYTRYGVEFREVHQP